MPPWIHSSQRKQRMLIDRRAWIVDSLHIAQPVVIEVSLGDLSRSQMHKHWPNSATGKFLPKLRHIADRLAAERAAEVPQEHQQNRRSLRKVQQVRPRFCANRGECRSDVFGWS